MKNERNLLIHADIVAAAAAAAAANEDDDDDEAVRYTLFLPIMLENAMWNEMKMCLCAALCRLCICRGWNYLNHFIIIDSVKRNANICHLAHTTRITLAIQNDAMRINRINAYT